MQVCEKSVQVLVFFVQVFPYIYIYKFNKYIYIGELFNYLVHGNNHILCTICARTRAHHTHITRTSRAHHTCVPEA